MKASLLLPLLVLLALPAFAVRTPTNIALATGVVKSTDNAQMGMSDVFDGKASTGVTSAQNGNYIIVDFSGYVTSIDKQPVVYISEIIVVSKGKGKYTLFTLSEDGTTWKVVPGAQSVQATAGSVSHSVGVRTKQVKYVFNETNGEDLCELEIWGWRSGPGKISKLDRSIFFRGGSGTRGAAGTNGGHYTDRYFNGDFTDYTYCNGSGTTELVIPTTGLDGQGNDTGVAWYVTDFKVGHQGNAQYSLYYTTDSEPEWTYNQNGTIAAASDPRTWTLITGADHVQEAGTKTYLVNKNATAVKYVFNTCPNWTTHLAEVEVWAMDPEDIPCLHTNLDLATATWTVCTPATCTENAFEECFCPDCGFRFEREVPLSKLGHDFVATLTRAGRHDSWGSGYVTCARTLEDPDTHETTWSCDFRIDFDGEDVDLTTLGGPPINGVVQYTDLTVSSVGAEDGGIKPIYLMDNAWGNGWGGAFYFGTCSVNEYLQYAFGTTIELTKIEYSVINEYQTVYFYKYDPATGVETLLTTIPIEKIVTYEDREDPETGEVTQVNTSPGYQRLTVDFFVTDKSKKTFVDAIRMRIGDYVDPETGIVTVYRGYNYGANDRHTIVCEIHPWGTIQWAGPLTHNPATIMLLR